MLYACGIMLSPVLAYLRCARLLIFLQPPHSRYTVHFTVLKKHLRNAIVTKEKHESMDYDGFGRGERRQRTQ